MKEFGMKLKGYDKNVINNLNNINSPVGRLRVYKIVLRATYDTRALVSPSIL